MQVYRKEREKPLLLAIIVDKNATVDSPYCNAYCVCRRRRRDSAGFRTYTRVGGRRAAASHVGTFVQ